MNSLDADAVRRRFPALARTIDGRAAVYFDGPAGSQTPQSVIDAMADYLANHNANHGGVFATSRENDELLLQAQRAVADLLGVNDPATVVFGANMTTLTFAFSRALARTWRMGDEVIVTQLDHDANITPWRMAAEERGALVREVRIHPEDCTLDVESFRSKLSDRTRLVAVGGASNATGTINPVRQIADMAHAAGADVFLDAVHLAPHALLDVPAWNCDYLVCSAYKFFGPHVGILWSRRDRLASLTPYKVRPADDRSPDRWMTGTPNFEGIAGVRAAVDYLAELGGPAPTRRSALQQAFERIGNYESELGRRFLAGLQRLSSVALYGIADSERMHERVPTFALRIRGHSPRGVAEFLARRGIFVWHGNFYAQRLSEILGLEPEGMVRVGLLHYNTAEEVDRLLQALEQIEH